MTKKIVSWLAFMAVFLSFHSCSTESFEESPVASVNATKFSIVTRSQMSSVKGLLEKVSQAENKMSFPGGSVMKTQQDSLLEDMTIVTETALLIQTGERKTYTFKVTRPGNPSYVENLAVKNNADGTYSGVLIRYLLNSQDINSTSNGHGLDLSGKISIYPVEKLNIASRVVSQSSDCYTVTWETGVCASGQHYYGDTCNLTGNNRAGVPQIVSVINNCAGSAVDYLSEYTDGNQGGADYETWVYYGPGGSMVQEINDPCEKTKSRLNNPKMQSGLQELKNQSTIPKTDPNYGEKGIKFKEDGTPSATINGSEHSVNFGDKTGYQGGYHNHTEAGIPMLSPPDIDQLLQFALAQGNGSSTAVGNAYVGMIAPNGMHYIIQFNGIYQDALITFTDETLQPFKDRYQTRYGMISSGGTVGNEAIERFFFKTVKDMGLEGKINLQRVESDGTIKTIVKNTDGSTTAIPCP